MLKFIGRGSAFNPKEGNNCAYIKQNKNLILFDCGANIFERIINKDLLNNVDNVHVFVTHTHADHVGSLGSLIDYVYYILKNKTNVYCGDAKLAELLKLQKISEEVYNFYHNEDAYLYSIDNMEIKFYKTKHIGDDCYGIIINLSDGSCIDYSGDSSEITNLNLFLHGTNYLYQDISTNDFEGNVHVSYRKLCDLIPQEHRKRVYIMHINGDFNIEKATLEGFNVVTLD